MKYVDNVMETVKDGITVANLRRTDIQKVSIYDYTQYKHEPGNWEEATGETGNLIYFGESKIYNQYPTMWKNFDSQWTYEYSEGSGKGNDKECEIWERENGYEIETGVVTVNNTKFKQSYYAHDYKSDKSEFVNEEYYNLLFNGDGTDSPMNKDCWLAGRYVRCDNDDYCTFGLNLVEGYSDHCRVRGPYLYASNR